MNYTQLRAQVSAWLSRNDLDPVVPDFIALAEERFNRQLRVSQMEVALPEAPIVDDRITLPATAADVKLLWIPGMESATIAPQALEFVIATKTSGLPTNYAKNGADLVFNGGGSVQGVYFEKIPALSSAGANWLSESAPSAYLFGALAEAALYMGGDPSIFEARMNGVLTDIQSNDQRYNGPLTARAR